MRIDPKGRLFIGVKIDSKLREALAQATPGDRHYFDDPDSPYLRVLSQGDEQWIGKVVDGNFPASELEDVLRNIISILNRVAAGVRHSPTNMRIFHVDETPAVSPSSPQPPRGPILSDY